MGVKYIPNIRLIDRHLRQANKLGASDLVGNTGVTAEWLGVTQKGAAGLVHMRFTTTAAAVLWTAGGAENEAGGLKLADLPALHIQPLASRVQGTITMSAGDTTAGEIGLGTVVATGAVNTLGGTGTFENLMEGVTQGNSSSSVLTVDTYSTGAFRPGFNGTAAAPDIFLNFATAAGAAATATLAVGAVVDFWALLITD